MRKLNKTYRQIQKLKDWLIPVGLVMCSLTSSAQHKYISKEVVKFHGNVFLLQDIAPDTFQFEDPVTGEPIIKVPVYEHVPVRIGKTEIFCGADRKLYSAYGEPFAKPVYRNMSFHLDGYIFRHIKPVLRKLNNGVYYLALNNAVINPKGKIVYYEFAGLEPERPEFKVPPRINRLMDRKLAHAFRHAPATTSYTLHGKPIYYTSAKEFMFFIVHVQDGKVRDMNKE